MDSRLLAILERMIPLAGRLTVGRVAGMAIYGRRCEVDHLWSLADCIIRLLAGEKAASEIAMDWDGSEWSADDMVAAADLLEWCVDKLGGRDDLVQG